MARKKHRKRVRPPDPEELFFAEPTPPYFTLVEEPSERAERNFAAAAATRANRSRFLPMVKIVVTACAVLIFAGGIRSAVARSHYESSVEKSAPTPTPYAAASPPMPANSAGSEIATAIAEERPLGLDAVASRDKAYESQLKLEHGAVKASIDLGEEAVRLGPASARAWLILGAAYQQRGDLKNAWRCYHACVDRGGDGKDRGECASML